MISNTTIVVHCIIVITMNNKYFCSINDVKETLDLYGVAIIPSVLSSSECIDMNIGMWEYLENLTSCWEIPISRKIPETWKEIKHLYMSHSMLIKHFEIGHAQYVWNVRQNPNICQIFANIWNCNNDDLLVSFDGASIHLPPEITGSGWFRNSWFHTDQSYTNRSASCVQGLVTGLDVNELDATLVVLEGSHKYHNAIGDKFNIQCKDNWYKVSDDMQQAYIEMGCIESHITCPAGSLVLWDSRTIHYGCEAHKERTISNIRNVVYVCYMPRLISNKKQLKQLEKKRMYFENKRMTSHYPCILKVCSVKPHTYGATIKETTPLCVPQLNSLGRRLAGY